MKNNIKCHPEPLAQRVEGSQPYCHPELACPRAQRRKTSQQNHITPRDIAENARLNFEITEELRKYKKRHPEHCEG